jgi:LysM repeat protein
MRASGERSIDLVHRALRETAPPVRGVPKQTGGFGALEEKLLRVPLTLALTLLAALAGRAEAASLTPSHTGLLRQVHAARDHGFAYASDDADVVQMVMRGELVRLGGDRNYLVKDTVHQPYARPEVKLFVERLAGQYRAACGERMVVTSLVRARTRQPRNASPLSVHPTGMAMDLRVPQRSSCRSWLERALLSLEDRKLLEAARERHPPHYHVVLFPEPYVGYVMAREGAGEVAGYRSSEVAAAVAGGGEYTVRSGDSLWGIARRFGTTTVALQRANGLGSTKLRPGQVLALPGGAAPAAVPAVVIAEAPATTTSYRVRSGDSLWSIARRFGTTAPALQRANGLRSTLLRPGQELAIPAGGGERGPVLATYRVRQGDNLWAIARRHGTSPRQIQRANSLPSSRIKPGQVLTIPSTGR